MTWVDIKLYFTFDVVISAVNYLCLCLGCYHSAVLVGPQPMTIPYLCGLLFVHILITQYSYRYFLIFIEFRYTLVTITLYVFSSSFVV